MKEGIDKEEHVSSFKIPELAITETDVDSHTVKMMIVKYNKEIEIEAILVETMTDAQEEETITEETTEEDSEEEERLVSIGKKDLVVTVIVADSYIQILTEEAEVVPTVVMMKEMIEEVETEVATTTEETITVVTVDTEVTTEETTEIVSVSNSKKTVNATTEITADFLMKNNLKSKELLKENQEVNASNSNKKVNAHTVKTVNSHMTLKVKMSMKTLRMLKHQLLKVVMMND